jgi:ParB-like chromosome segregation protein Spo0J
MSAHRYEALKKAVDQKGFLQAILVRSHPDLPDLFEIVDGHHRVRAAKELGYSGTLPAQDVTGFTDEEVEATRLMMGNRGELDLTIASEVLDDLVAAGWTHEDLEITGFDEDELNALIGATKETEESELLEETIKIEQTRVSDPDVFVLEVAFANSKELNKARSVLRKAGGKGNKDLAKGFRSLAGWE